MRKILIWTAESDYDARAVAKISEKIKQFYQLEVNIEQGSKRAYNKSVNQVDGLKKQVEIYCKSSDLIIFLIDSDGIGINIFKPKNS